MHSSLGPKTTTENPACPGSFAMSSWPRSNGLHPGPAGPGSKVDRYLSEHKPIRTRAPDHLVISRHLITPGGQTRRY